MLASSKVECMIHYLQTEYNLFPINNLKILKEITKAC